MEEKKRYSIKQVLLTTLWIGVAAGVGVLLVAAIHKKDTKLCKGVEIDIEGVSNNFFVDKTDILNTIKAIAKEDPQGKTTGSFDLKLIENALEKNTWVKSAQLFFDNNEILQVKLHEREPVARVFTTAGTTFYIDNDVAMLPLSEKYSARLPVFTGFPSDKKVLTVADSNLLRDIKLLSGAIQKDSFRMAMIEQVDITPQRTFEMIPKIGNQVIVFGDATNIEDKFARLQLFYKEVMAKSGWNSYSIIDVQYKNQVVAKRKGAQEITADSLRTLQMMDIIAANAEKQSDDSLQAATPEIDHGPADSSMIQQSIQRDDSGRAEKVFVPPAPDAVTVPVVKPPVATVTKPAKTVDNKKPVIIKPSVKKPITNTKPIVKKPPEKKPAAKPKATMPKKRNNDY